MVNIDYRYIAEALPSYSREGWDARPVFFPLPWIWIMKSILCAEPAHYEAPHNKTLEMAV